MSEGDSVIGTILTGTIGMLCKGFMFSLNRTTVHYEEKLHDALWNRPENQGLITVSNHVSALDDPLIVSVLIPPKAFLDITNIRWTLCATNRCFTNPALGKFVSYGRVLPVTRGHGLNQTGMLQAASKLRIGEWVHLFPEGTRSLGKRLLPMKPGVGKLIAEAKTTPLVIPFVHSGMENILPKGSKMFGVAHEVDILVGDPIEFDDILERKEDFDNSKKLYMAIANRIGERLTDLKGKLKERIQESNSK